MEVEELEGLAAMDVPWMASNVAEQTWHALPATNLQSCLRSTYGLSPVRPGYASECLVPIDGNMWTHKQASRYTSATP